ncbi:MAG: amidohydrolase family protein [Pirellulales bacterium]|nr:amidohydrolase family protein [Pirellulales bacterium]
MHPYVDHVGLWAKELREWLPDMIFDAHVHVGPPEVMGRLGDERKKLALSTFTSLTWEELQAWHAQLFLGKRVAGLIGFPFPLREVDQDAANRYIIRLMKTVPGFHGFLLAHPTDVGRSLAAFDAAVREGVRFSGVKPYFDLLGKGVFESTMPEFIPEGLLEFMNRQRLVLMLHTSGRGVGEAATQEYLRRVLDRYPDLRIVLAHMGRYLETSSATLVEVYRRALEHHGVHRRLVFGTDLPFGLITGVEAWSDTHGAIFVTRDIYSWSDPTLTSDAVDPTQLTYNTYHVVKAIKDAVETMGLSAAEAESLKESIFYGNAASLFGTGD